jgi:methyl-accepting chemotaxis protein
MKNLSMKVKDGSAEIDKGSKTMIQEISALQSSAGEIESRMENISSGIRKLNTSAQDVSNLAADSHASIEKISGIANGFVS